MFQQKADCRYLKEFRLSTIDYMKTGPLTLAAVVFTTAVVACAQDTEAPPPPGAATNTNQAATTPFSNETTPTTPLTETAPNAPAQVTYENALAYCDNLSTQTGVTHRFPTPEELLNAPDIISGAYWVIAFNEKLEKWVIGSFSIETQTISPIHNGDLAAVICIPIDNPPFTPNDSLVLDPQDEM